MKRIIRPSGMIAAYVWDVPGGDLPHEWLQKEFHNRGIEYPLPPSSAVSSLDELEKLWNEADLRSIECKQIKVSETFTNFFEFGISQLKLLHCQ